MCSHTVVQLGRFVTYVGVVCVCVCVCACVRACVAQLVQILTDGLIMLTPFSLIPSVCLYA